MTILTEILKYFNAIIEQSKLYERVYGLSEYSEKEKRYIRYLGDGQYEILHDFDRYAGTFFWVKSGKTLISPARNQIDGCMTDIQVLFNIRAVSVIQKRLLKCDGADDADYVALTTLKLLQNSEKKLQNVLGLKSIALNGVSYEPKITGIENDKNYSQVSIDFQLIITAKQECFNNDICIDTSTIPIEVIKKACVDILVEGQQLPNPLTANFVAGNNVQIIIDIDGNIVISGIGGVQSVTGLDTDNTDPANPVVQIAVDGVTITGDGTPGNPLVSTAIGGVQTVTDDGNGVVSVDNTDPVNPEIQFNGVNVDGVTITGDGTAGNPLVGASSFALTIKDNSTTVDSNVDEINFLGPLTAVQTAAGKVTVGLNNASIISSLMLELLRFGDISINANTVLYLPTQNKLYVFNGTNAVSIYDATTAERLAVVSAGNSLGLDYISSINEVWAKGAVTNIVRINPVTNASLGTLAIATNNPLAKMIEYLATGNDRVFFFYQANVLTITIRDLVTNTTSSINWSTTIACFWAALCSNPLSAMNNHIVVVRAGGFGVVDADANSVVVNLDTTGFAATANNWTGVDYSPSLDVFIIACPAQNRVVYLQPATASTFTVIRTLHYLSKPSFVRVDELNGLLLVVCNATPLGNLTLSKIDLVTGDPLGNILLSNVANGENSYMDIDPVNRFAYVGARNTTAGNNTPTVKVKY